VDAQGACNSIGEARLQALLDAAADAVVIMGEDLRVQLFSKSAERLFGYEAAEVVGRNVSMLMPEPMRSQHDGFVKRYLDGGERHVIGMGREVMARRKNGAPFPCYLSLGEGQAAGGRFFIGILHDLSREKDTYRRMRQLAALVDSTGDAVVGQTLDGIVTYWNKGARELYGYSAAEAIGRDAAEIIVPLERQEELAAIRDRIARGEGVARIETVRSHKSGRRLAVSLTISPILDETGAVSGASSIARDITARRAAEKAMSDARRAAEEANRVKTDFLNIVSHELRTPLTVILGNIALLTGQHGAASPAEAAGIARDIEESATRLLALINDLLDISDMEAGLAKLRLAPTQAEELIIEVVQAAEVMAARKGLTVTFFSEPMELMADPLRLKQALINLVDNAVKFTEAGNICVGVSRAGNTALFEVSDTGQGMTDEQITRIFDAFHQGDTSSTRKAQGTGLGLTIVKRIVDLHGGAVTVESEPGQGTTIRLAIPLAGREG
jgi:PAS domain S-box-containing protein